MDFGQIFQLLGIPAGLLAIALVTGKSGVWVWGYLLVKAEQDAEKDIAVCRADADRRIAEALASFERERAVWVTRLAEKDTQIGQQREQVEVLLAHVQTYTEVARETKRRASP